MIKREIKIYTVGVRHMTAGDLRSDIGNKTELMKGMYKGKKNWSHSI